MHLTPDERIFWQMGFFDLNLTIVTTWALLFLMTLGAWLVTRNLQQGLHRSRGQNVLEMLVLGILDQMKEVGLKEPRKYIAFVGTLFLFVAVSNVCSIIPYYEPPTGSLSTTVALSLCIFIAVPVFGIAEQGIGGYLRTYLQPNAIMLPFNIIGELSRTISLAVRLFGNIMSGGLIVTILLGIAPFFFPVIMNVLGLLTGIIQAYIFSILATVYISAAVQANEASLQKRSISSTKINS